MSIMNELVVPLITSTVLVLAVVLIHYEVLRYTSRLLPRLTIPPRPRILVVIVAAFFAHTLEVWLYALAYYFFVHHFDMGSLGGVTQHRFIDYLYFSTSTYTSLGYGDIYPLGGLRFMAGIEAVAGLMMIGWSASFTYLAMEKFWDLHGPHNW